MRLSRAVFRGSEDHQIGRSWASIAGSKSIVTVFEGLLSYHFSLPLWLTYIFWSYIAARITKFKAADPDKPVCWDSYISCMSALSENKQVRA